MSSEGHLVPSRKLRSRVAKLIAEHGLIQAGDRVLVGVSGGADSTCLLLVLASLQRSLEFELEAAHFDHGLRGQRTAKSEERFVRYVAETLGVPLYTGHGDVRKQAKGHKQSLEEAARELRYRFLARTAALAESGTVAVGHTLNDQAETVLLHLTRGSGLRGLAAMSPSSPWPVRTKNAPCLIRPLLQLTRDETTAVCQATQLSPVDDPSNSSPKHTRSRIRHELLPLLREFNPRIEDALARLAASSAEDIEVLEQLAAAALAEQTAAGEVRIDRRRFADLPPSLRRHAVRLAVRQLLGDARNLSDRHVRAVVRAAAGPSGARLDLPRGVRAKVERTTVLLSVDATDPAVLPARGVALAIPGSTKFGTWTITAKMLSRRPPSLGASDGRLAVLDADVCAGLRVRRCRPGDRFQPLGMKGVKKLQDYFVDEHVPRETRPSLPVVTAKKGIAWIATQRPAEWAKVTPQTKRYLRLTVSS